MEDNELFGERHEQEENGLFGKRHLEDVSGSTLLPDKTCDVCGSTNTIGAPHMGVNCLDCHPLTTNNKTE